MSLAATEAGISFNNSSVTIVHGMSRPIGALFHIAHGLSNAILLEECMRFVIDGAYDRFGEMSRSLGFSASMNDKEASEAFLAQEAQLLKDLDIPSMSQLGIDRRVYEENIPKMARDAFASGSPSNTIKDIRVEDMENLYRKIYR
jgi:alcohol dehydrogenase class IV